MTECDLCHKSLPEDKEYLSNPVINWHIEYWRLEDGQIFRFHKDCLYRRKLELILGRPIN